LTAATYILKLLSKGYTKDQIIYGKFNGDMQLVCAWIDFLKDKNWVVEKENIIDGTDLKVTKKGKMWLTRFESAHIKVKN
jgi:predicted transcriptional regulator